MRKTMTKEITITTCKIAVLELVKGQPVVHELGEATFLGEYTETKLRKEASKRQGKDVAVYNIDVITKTYEMSVEEFMKYATPKEDEKDGTDTQ